MTWVEGRKLDTVTVNGQTYTYVYNSDGQRVKKIHPDGSYIEYYVMDGVSVGESHFTATGNKTLGIRYTLDENNSVIGLTINGVNYYFAKNLQGDVLAVYNASTNEIAAQYTYDSWGNILTATGTLAETNPFRYRGYYYDEETDFYYLQSRYYDAKIGRFVNADSYASTGQGILGNNMFAYCNNNSINYVDPSGQFLQELWDTFTQYLKQCSGYFAFAGGATQADSIAIGPGDVVGVLMVAGGVLVCGGVALGTTVYKEFKHDKALSTAKSYGKSISTPDETYVAHHIVAKAAHLAQPARIVLESVGINPRTDGLNLAIIPQSKHVSMHTDAYYRYINNRLYGLEGDYDAVIGTLAELQTEIQLYCQTGWKAW